MKVGCEFKLTVIVIAKQGPMTSLYYCTVVVSNFHYFPAKTMTQNAAAHDIL